MIISHNGGFVNLRSTQTYTGITGNPITIRGRISGFYMERTREYYRRVDGSRHFLRKPPAITNDVAALDMAQQMGADRVRIVETRPLSKLKCWSLAEVISH